MSRSDTSRLLGLATKVLAEKAVERAKGGWVPEKERIKQQKNTENRKKKADGGSITENQDNQPYDLGQQIQKGTEMVSRIPESVNRLYVEPITTGIQELMRPVFEGGGPESYQNPEMVGHAMDVVGGLGAGSLLTGSAAAETGILRSGMGPVAKKDAQTGIRAYHGSPHEFEKFDISKIGTGEGAQAYGHGLYFAEAEPTAKEYRDKLTSGIYKTSEGGIFDPSDLEHLNLRTSGRRSIDEALLKANELMSSQPQNAEMIQRDLDKLIAAQEKSAAPYSGHMYEVNINAQPEHFLDWDKPFTDQSSYVKDVLKRSGLMKEYTENLSDFSTPMATRNKMKRGENIHAFVEHKMGKDSEKASQYLTDLGIKGIKYLDAGSRDKRRGTRNFVVFDPENIEIMRRYAIGGDVEPQHLATGGEASSLDKTMEFADKFGGEEIQSPFIGTEMGIQPRSHEQFLSQMDIKPDVVPTTTERPVYVEPKKEESYVADLLSAANMAKQYGASFLDDLSNILSKEKIQKFAESLPTAEENIQSLKDVAGKIGEFIAPPAYERGGKVQNLKNGGRVYPLSDREDWKSHQRDPDGKIVHMKPDEFLDKAQKLEDTKENHKDIKHWEKKIKKGKKIGPAALYTDGSQDGRHRVEAAKKLGITKVPVLTWPDRGEKPAQDYVKSAHKIARTAFKKRG